jgi:hypothetical protein
MHRSVMQGHNTLRRTCDIGETLFMCENYHRFDQRDKIFGLLALCCPSYRREIEVDYSLCLVETFLRVVECIARIETNGQTHMWVACLVYRVLLGDTGNHPTIELVCRNIHIRPLETVTEARCVGTVSSRKLIESEHSMFPEGFVAGMAPQPLQKALFSDQAGRWHFGRANDLGDGHVPLVREDLSMHLL